MNYSTPQEKSVILQQIMLFYKKRLKYREISQKTGVPQGTIGRLIHENRNPLWGDRRLFNKVSDPKKKIEALRGYSLQDKCKADIPDKGCKYISGEGHTATYCGCDVWAKKSYCETHYAIMYGKSKPINTHKSLSAPVKIKQKPILIKPLPPKPIYPCDDNGKYWLFEHLPILSPLIHLKKSKKRLYRKSEEFKLQEIGGFYDLWSMQQNTQSACTIH